MALEIRTVGRSLAEAKSRKVDIKAGTGAEQRLLVAHLMRRTLMENVR